MPVLAVKRRASVSIWAANSREGAKINTSGEYAPGPAACFCICTGSEESSFGPVPVPILERRPSFKSREKQGSRNASVLPEPVLATPMRSRPEQRMGQACAWIGVGSVKPAPRIASTRVFVRPSSAASRLVQGAQGSSPSTPVRDAWSSSKTSMLSGGSSQPRLLSWAVLSLLLSFNFCFLRRASSSSTLCCSTEKVCFSEA
mmetsp:Transcript_315/g.604  ORF Transcript_315/g.604 Transcript_315/m.604 type:complete len:202 (-) Transcript_315:169-774(-)